MSSHPWKSLDAAPLITLVNAASAAPSATAGQKSLRRAWHRATSTGRVTVLMGDHLAVKLLGMHPAEVWGDEWFVHVA